MGQPTSDTAEVEATVAALGAQGDGIAEVGGQRLYIPFAAPGDRLRVTPGAPRGDGREARIVRMLAPGPNRIDPACPHFGLCGGCALQHLSPTAAADHKRGLLQRALAHRGLDAPVAETVAIPPGTRRRVSFAFRRGRTPVLGLNRRASQEVFDLSACPVLHPDLTALVAPLRRALAPLAALGRQADLRLTRTDSGIDMLLVPERPRAPDLDTRMTLAELAETNDLARISWQADPRRGGPAIEPIAARRAPRVTFGDVTVRIPADAFLQPSVEGERALAGLAAAAIENAPHPVRRIADLYAGCGSLSFPLARLAPVHAVEGDATMLAALSGARGTRPMTTEVRDLARRPLLATELAGFDAVVFDPPRAGARTQAAEIAASRVPTVIAVSCNPATMGRDLRLLVDGGYRIERAVPVDQFPWSAHVEAVAVLRRT
ncbi:MAG: class I SAM-dependent RNA methyltransferase [Alphaproteobacteria bacterium]